MKDLKVTLMKLTGNLFGANFDLNILYGSFFHKTRTGIELEIEIKANSVPTASQK